MSRDMTRREFDAACVRYGFKPQCLGYYDIGNNWHVNKLNGGNRRRDQLAYLIRMSEEKAALA
jgi:hypothetical protein